MPLMSIWSCNLKIFVSWWTFSVGAVLLQPVIVRRAVFYVICSLLRFVSLRSGCQTVCA